MKQSLNCGSCLFLNRERVFENKCSEDGKLPTSKGCMSYKPDMFSLVGSEEKISRVSKVSQAIRGMSPTELQALGSVLHAERNTRKAGWRFYQKVYVRYTGSADRNFLSNFAVGFVLYADKETVRVVGRSGKMFISAINDPNSETVYTVERFAVMRSAMIKKGKFVDPKANAIAPSSERGHVAQLDDALESVETLSKKVKVSKAREDDLVSIISRMSRGMIGRGERRGAAERRGPAGEIVMSYT